ncbi:Dual specificity, serine/threonine and tyrosine kinase, partial [Trachipleistophora hominis]
SENKISCQIEKDDYTLSVTESLNKMMNSRLKRCGFDGASNGSAISTGNDRKNTANDTKLGVGAGSTTAAVVRTVRRSIERDLGTTTKNTDKIVLNGKDLQVLSVIGKGGSSKVYKVSHGSNVFALKVIKNVTDRKVLQSYENEINLMIKLRGTAEIIELHDYAINKDEIGCTILLLMEYGECDLTHFLKTRELRTSDIFDIFWQMLMNMNAIYDQRIIHADLKPANFVICGNKLKLIDFGISREIRTDTTNVIQESKVGTINYMSPESLCGNKTSRRSDIWSLGVILYEMVYKRNFMDGMNCWQKIDFLKGTEPVQFPDENTGDSMLEMLKGMCAMCLCKEPEHRPTVKDLIYLVKEHRDAVRVRGRDIKALVHRVIETVERDRLNGHLLVDQMVDEFMEEMRKENR